jgi:hypothetical protein
VVPREELSRDRSRQVCWLDLHMGPVTFQILDQAGCVGAVERFYIPPITPRSRSSWTAPTTPKDPTESDYTPPSSA